MRAKRACSSASEARIVAPGLVGGIASETEGKTNGKTEGDAEGMAVQFIAHGSAVQNKGSAGPRGQGRGSIIRNARFAHIIRNARCASLAC